MNTFFLSAVFAATVTTGKMTLPTYMFSDGDPVPKTRSDYYPYYRFDGYEAKSSPRDWKTVTLESDRLKVTITPEVGGKVWGAVDKLTGVDFIYFNNVAKFRDISMRGPWSSGGIRTPGRNAGCGCWRPRAANWPGAAPAAARCTTTWGT
jgi:hypothetical protein